MRTATPRFLQAVRYSHVIAAACDLVFPTGGPPVAVAVQGGQVTIDRTAQNRRRGSIQIPWSPALAGDLDLRTLPLGGYAIVRRGVRYASGATELMLLGTLRVESVSWGTTEDSANLELSDRMSQVRDEPFTAPYAAAGQRPHQAAIAIVQQVFGTSIAYHAPFQPAAVLADVFYTGERTDALSALEQAYGAETYFDAAGDFVFAQKPADDELVVWTVDAGQDGVMVAAGENLDRTGIYNGVLVNGQATADTAPISALSTFDDPASPVRWGGPFGHVLLIAESSSVQDVTQAQATADSLLRLRLKQTRSLELTAAPNPALEAGDTITVRFPDGRLEEHLIDAVTVDLGTQAQTITTRTNEAP